MPLVHGDFRITDNITQSETVYQDFVWSRLQRKSPKVGVLHEPRLLWPIIY